MQRVGDPIDGYCNKCKRNVFMTVGATDGREIFATICRTCQTKQDYQPEVSNEVLQEQAMRKLARAAAKKRKMPMGRSPDVVSRGRRGENRAAFDASVLDRAIAERQSRLAGGEADRVVGRRMVDLAPRDFSSLESPRRDLLARAGSGREDGETGPAWATAAGAGDRTGGGDRPGDNDAEAAPAKADAPRQRPGAAYAGDLVGTGSASGAAGERASNGAAGEAPQQRLSEALRHRPSLHEGPLPAGRRRSGASALQMPMTLPKPKEEVLPPPSVDSNDTARWRQLTAKLGPRDGKVYASEKSYTIGEVLLHKRHGMGIVEEILHDTAMMVLFRDRREVIEMARADAR